MTAAGRGSRGEDHRLSSRRQVRATQSPTRSCEATVPQSTTQKMNSFTYMKFETLSRASLEARRRHMLRLA